MIEAVFLPPIDGEMLLCDMEALAFEAHRNGLKMYWNGDRFAWLSRPIKGWLLYMGGHTKCAA